MSKLTVAQAMQQLRFHGLVLKDYDGDYCVNYQHGGFGTAYYTSSLADAVTHGVAMARQRDAKAVGRRNKALEAQVQA